MVGDMRQKEKMSLLQTKVDLLKARQLGIPAALLPSGIVVPVMLARAMERGEGTE